jgi:hypothetical protein
MALKRKVRKRKKEKKRKRMEVPQNSVNSKLRTNGHKNKLLIKKKSVNSKLQSWHLNGSVLLCYLDRASSSLFF